MVCAKAARSLNAYVRHGGGVRDFNVYMFRTDKDGTVRQQFIMRRMLQNIYIYSFYMRIVSLSEFCYSRNCLGFLYTVA